MSTLPGPPDMHGADPSAPTPTLQHEAALLEQALEPILLWAFGGPILRWNEDRGHVEESSDDDN